MYLLLIEIIFGMYILLLPYSLQNMVIPIIPYFLLMITCCFIFMLMLIKFKEKAKLLFFILILPAILLAGNWIGFHITGSLLIGLFVFWRTISHYNEHDKQNGGKWILFTILMGIFLIYFAGLFSDHYMFLISMIMIGQILFIIIGGFIRRWLEVETAIINKRNFLLSLIGLLSVIGVIGVILTAGMKLYEKLFFSILNLGATAFAFIASPFFKWAEVQNWSEKMEKIQSMQGTGEDLVIPSKIEFKEGTSNFDPALIASIIFILGLTILFYYIYKRHKKRNTEMTIALKGFSSENFSTTENELFLKRIKTATPKNSIRKEVFAFERLAQKHKVGRLPFESLSEWMRRIEIMDCEDINTIYEKVRYGHNSYSESEERLLKEKLQLKKREIKERKKNQK